MWFWNEITEALPRTVNAKPKPRTTLKSDKSRSALITTGKKVKEIIYLINDS